MTHVVEAWFRAGSESRDGRAASGSRAATSWSPNGLPASLRHPIFLLFHLALRRRIGSATTALGTTMGKNLVQSHVRTKARAAWLRHTSVAGGESAKQRAGSQSSALLEARATGATVRYGDCLFLPRRDFGPHRLQKDLATSRAHANTSAIFGRPFDWSGRSAPGDGHSPTLGVFCSRGRRAADRAHFALLSHLPRRGGRPELAPRMGVT